MDKSQLRVRPIFIFWLFVLLFGVPWLFGTLFSGNNLRAKSKTINTAREVREIAALVSAHFGSAGVSPVSSNGCFLPAIVDAARVGLHHANVTNSEGEMLDFWDTAYRIEVGVQTNVIVRSAGPNRHIGDRDDIIFNSASNVFVKP